MILSLEEEEEEADDLGGGASGDPRLLGLDGELLAVNGRVLLPGQSMAATSERNLCQASAAAADKASVCSCTCYGSRQRQQQREQQVRTVLFS